MNELITIPFCQGMSIRIEPAFAHQLAVVMPHLTNITADLRRIAFSPTISDYIDTVQGRLLRESNHSAKSKSMLLRRVQKLKLVLTQDDPERRIAQIEDVDIRKFKDRLPQVLRRNQRSASQGTNIERYYQLFNRIMQQALEDKLLLNHLSISITRKKSAELTKPFLDVDLNSLFGSWPLAPYPDGFTGQLLADAKPYRFWLMPLGLLTGARLNELCQLQASDVIEDRAGVRLLSINDNHPFKSLKNEQSRREIPLCSKLIGMGFLEFVEERRQADGPQAFLFKELEYHPEHLLSRDPSRFYCGPRTGAGFIGQHCSNAEMGGLNFKSFRRTFAMRLEKSGIPDRTIAKLLGHGSETLHVTVKHYLAGIPSQVLLEQMERGLCFNMELSGIHWRHYKNLMASQKLRGKRGRRRKK
jgi:integrase